MSKSIEQVQVTKFKLLPGDTLRFSDKKSSSKKKSTENALAYEDTWPIRNKCHLNKLPANFSLDYSHPAVAFDNVQFSVDRKGQRNDFMSNLFYELKNLVIPSSSSGPNNGRVQILKSVNLNVPHGSIFGLLGPSSCGKTTLLRCLLGILKPDSGLIRLFGSADGKSSQIPGPNVGYMPQDLGLYEDFSIRQLLTVFGRYSGMSSTLIAKRLDFMSAFLDLPDLDRKIETLSGGQKRRVSFAMACLHMPPLIILDEPTVGVDPLLRQSIWKYLRRLADEENKTIIITTHYIEEAAQADQVAFMRAGQVLVQDEPKRIMEINGCKTLEEAFLKICNDIGLSSDSSSKPKLFPQSKFTWHDQFDLRVEDGDDEMSARDKDVPSDKTKDDEFLKELKQRAQEKMEMFENLRKQKGLKGRPVVASSDTMDNDSCSILSEIPGLQFVELPKLPRSSWHGDFQKSHVCNQISRVKRFRGTKLVFQESKCRECNHSTAEVKHRQGAPNRGPSTSLVSGSRRFYRTCCALIYKNAKRNLNSIPLIAFQFILPVIQMISFSLCVGGKPMNVGLGIVNLDQQSGGTSLSHLGIAATNLNSTSLHPTDDLDKYSYNDLLSLKYLSFIDNEMLNLQHYDNLTSALRDVAQAKLWAVMEIGANFTDAMLERFDVENFYQIDLATIEQSVIKLYTDRSNRILDMICQRSLADSYKNFIIDQFEHFHHLPIQVKRPVFEVGRNIISNSIDGYTESIASGLLASLTYIMAAGLTTFIMVLERGAGILERTYTCGVSPVAYLLVHASFRSIVMMTQIIVVLFVTFSVLKQPLMGSIWLAYSQLMILNITGISYGFLVSSFVSDQNGAALAVVGSLVVKLTMSGILWPLEAIPRWLRAVCYVQPLTMPIQALKAITLKGADLSDQVVVWGFVVSLAWSTVFLLIATKRFKFYQH